MSAPIKAKDITMCVEYDHLGSGIVKEKLTVTVLPESGPAVSFLIERTLPDRCDGLGCGGHGPQDYLVKGDA